MEAYLHAFFYRRIYLTIAVREALLADFRFIEEHSLTDGMAVFAPIDRLPNKLTSVRTIFNRTISPEKGWDR